MGMHCDGPQRKIRYTLLAAEVEGYIVEMVVLSDGTMWSVKHRERKQERHGPAPTFEEAETKALDAIERMKREWAARTA